MSGLPAGRREEALEADDHRCQLCGEPGPGAGGTAELHVHHQRDDPEGMDYHSLENLTVVCRPCHNHVHNRMTSDDLDLDLDAMTGDAVLIPHDYEVVAALSSQGPLMTSQIVQELTNDYTAQATRERLYYLAGVDMTDDRIAYPIVDKDAETGEWGLYGQIESPIRGVLPETETELNAHVRDLVALELLEAGQSRSWVADFVGVHSRTTWMMERRARARRLPVDLTNSAESEAGTDSHTPAEQDDRRESDGRSDIVGDSIDVDGLEELLHEVLARQ